MIGADLSVAFNRRNKNINTLKNLDIIVKKVDISDNTAKKYLLLMQLN